MKKLIPVVFCALAAVSCKSTSRDVVETGLVLGNTYPVNDHYLEIEFGSDRVEGTASGSVLFWLFEWGPEHYSDGLEYHVGQTGGGVETFSGLFYSMFNGIAGLFPDMGGRVRSAAVRDACDKAECDLLGAPMFFIDEMDYVVFKTQTIRVTGFPGMIKSMTNQPAPEKSWLERLPDRVEQVDINISDKTR